MSEIKSLIAMVGGVGVVMFCMIALFFAIGAFCWPYTINTWLVYSGKPPAIEWWMGGLIGLVPGIGQLSIPIAVITFILMLFLVSPVMGA